LNIFADLIRQWWEDGNYSHGFLIPMVSGFLAWRKRGEMDRLERKPNNLGFLFLILGLSSLILGHLGAEFFVQRISMLLVIFSLLLLGMGWDYVRILFFPFCFLIFMIPLPYILYDSMTFPLQICASKLSSASLKFLQIPVFRDGNIIQLASTTLQVEEACSGIRSLITLLALTTLYSYFTQKLILSRIILILSAIPIAVISNSFRVSLAGIIANSYGEKAAHGLSHEFSGWLVFPLAFFLIHLFGKVLCSIPFLNENTKK
jgi:exosortase